MLKFQRRSLLVFVVLFAVTLPFPLSFFPSPGDFLHGFFQKLNQFSAEHLFGMKPGYTARMESDSTGLYIHVFHLAVFSLLAGWISILFFKKTNEEKLKYLLNASATYILAFFLLKYGFDKVFKVQFYLPEPNTLYTPLGFLSKDILFWSTVGSSYSYSVFSGLMEIIPALLLFSRRTRLLGGIIAFGVMLHVLVINFSFDISVKILSIYLLLLAAIVIRPYFRMLAGIFILQKTDFPRPEIEKINKSKNKTRRFLKALVIVFVLFESLYIYVDQNNFNDDLAPRPKFHGTYQLLEQNTTISGKSAYFGNLSAVQRVFIHRKGYLILQFQNDSMKDFPIMLSPDGKTTVKTSHGFVEMNIHVDSTTKEYTFSWIENGQPLNLTGKKLDQNQLPLLKDHFIWNIDDYHE